jgi:hypothetical protein
MCFFKSAEKACLGPNEPFSTLKTLICRNYSLQYSLRWHRKSVQDSEDSNMGSFFVQMHVFRQMMWLHLFVTKGAFLDFENAKLQIDFFIN